MTTLSNTGSSSIIGEELYNLATENKWVAVMPIKSISEDLTTDNSFFNLTNFRMPNLTVHSTSIKYRGSEMHIPTDVRMNKEPALFEYLLSEEWHQYKILYHWFNKYANEEGVAENVPSEFLLPVTVYWLTGYKNIIHSVTFENSYIETIGGFDSDQQKAAPVIKPSFSLKFSRMRFEDFEI